MSHIIAYAYEKYCSNHGKHYILGTLSCFHLRKTGNTKAKSSKYISFWSNMHVLLSIHGYFHMKNKISIVLDFLSYTSFGRSHTDRKIQENPRRKRTGIYLLKYTHVVPIRALHRCFNLDLYRSQHNHYNMFKLCKIGLHNFVLFVLLGIGSVDIISCCWCSIFVCLAIRFITPTWHVWLCENKCIIILVDLIQGFDKSQWRKSKYKGKVRKIKIIGRDTCDSWLTHIQYIIYNQNIVVCIQPIRSSFQ